MQQWAASELGLYFMQIDQVQVHFEDGDAAELPCVSARNHRLSGVQRMLDRLSFSKARPFPKGLQPGGGGEIQPTSGFANAAPGRGSVESPEAIRAVRRELAAQLETIKSGEMLAPKVAQRLAVQNPPCESARQATIDVLGILKTSQRDPHYTAIVHMARFYPGARYKADPVFDSCCRLNNMWRAGDGHLQGPASVYHLFQRLRDLVQGRSFHQGPCL